MMNLLEIISLCMAACLCVICTKSDSREGIIYNKTLVIFAIIAIVIDSVYYGFFAKDLLFDFLPNLALVAAISLYLFYSHSFAGGDCKMTIVLALLYPARYYLVYRNSIVTLIFAIGFAIFVGYVYLLVSSIIAIVTKKVNLTREYVRNFICNFLKSYASAMVYIVLLNSVIILCDRVGVYVNNWVSWCAGIFIAWCVGSYPIFKKVFVLVPAIILAVVISAITHIVPISLNPENYTLVLILLLCQMTIKTTIYEKVQVDQLRKGMILTTFSSVLMQSSITKGLPGVSTEDLKSRLTSAEIESIKIWAKATHTEELTVVKKIPFAIFISIGFLSYFILWRMLV